MGLCCSRFTLRPVQGIGGDERFNKAHVTIEGMHMKISQPFVLLLGGLLSASSLGCSVIGAAVSDYRPASREGRGSTERMVAIGRVFESQGKYDQAEAMYRRALKQKPADPAIQEQLQQLADRRTGRKFDSASTSNAVVRSNAQSASGRASLAGKPAGRTTQVPHGTWNLHRSMSDGLLHHSTKQTPDQSSQLWRRAGPQRPLFNHPQSLQLI